MQKLKSKFVVCQEHSKLSLNTNLHQMDNAGPLEGKITLVVVDVHLKYIDGDAHVT